MILGMGASELVVILLIALVIFGPKNLPKPKAAEAHVSEASADNVEDADA